MQTPMEVLVMRQLLVRGWCRRRIAVEQGISRNTLDRYLALGDWQPYSTANRSGQLDGHRELSESWIWCSCVAWAAIPSAPWSWAGKAYPAGRGSFGAGWREQLSMRTGRVMQYSEDELISTMAVCRALVILPYERTFQ
jgi:hypothetical protein